MNAVNPVSSSPPSLAGSDAGAAEPSMEEILASIRRIIADDGPPRLTRGQDSDGGPASPASVAPAGPAHEVADVAPDDDAAGEELEAVSASVYEPPKAFSESHGVAATEPPPAERASEPTIELPRHPLAPPEVAGHGAVDLESEPPHPGRSEIPPGYVPQADVAARSQEAEPLISAAADSAVTAAFNTLAASRFVDSSEQLTGLVREMIRPLVKAWIDENLPAMVERVVVAEIERMARR